MLVKFNDFQIPKSFMMKMALVLFGKQESLKPNIFGQLQKSQKSYLQDIFMKNSVQPMLF
jgi:hypothetical protein